jgi:hypothetical protein
VVDVGSCVFGQPRVWRHPSAFSAVTRWVATRLEVKAQPWSKLQEGQLTQTVQVIDCKEGRGRVPRSRYQLPTALYASTLVLLLRPS